jgi:hypothetical protein
MPANTLSNIVINCPDQPFTLSGAITGQALELKLDVIAAGV